MLKRRSEKYYSVYCALDIKVHFRKDEWMKWVNSTEHLLEVHSTDNMDRFTCSALKSFSIHFEAHVVATGSLRSLSNLRWWYILKCKLDKI